MSLIHRRLRAGLIAVLGLAMIAMTGAFATSALASPAAAAPRYVALTGSATATTDAATGSYSSTGMSIEVALAPRNAAGLNSLLRGLYTRGSGDYQRWLAKGQFDARFAPGAATRSAVAGYLRQHGLAVGASSSPFLVRATGSSRQVSAAFQTSLHTYKGTGGARFFANSTAVRVPASLASAVLGVIGLTNTVPAAVPAVQRRPGPVLPRHHRYRPAHGQQRPVPDHAGIRPGHGDRHAEDGRADHRRLLTAAPSEVLDRLCALGDHGRA